MMWGWRLTSNGKETASGGGGGISGKRKEKEEPLLDKAATTASYGMTNGMGKSKDFEGKPVVPEEATASTRTTTLNGSSEEKNTPAKLDVATKKEAATKTEEENVFEHPSFYDLPLWRRWWVSFVTFWNVPMYTMGLLFFGIYIPSIYFAPNLWWKALLLSYVPYIVWDKKPCEGGWDVDTSCSYIFPKLRWTLREVCRSNPLFRCVATYFCDMRLIKTSELDPTRNYLFCYHPHGVIAMGANTALNTNGCDFTNVFPGIHRSAGTLNATFFAPLFREWLLMLGFTSVNRSTLKEQLTTSDPVHKSCVLVPGGAVEALYAHPGIFKLYLKKRRGFVRLALETGCVVVPCLGFGENEIFQTLYGGDEYEQLYGKPPSPQKPRQESPNNPAASLHTDDPPPTPQEKQQQEDANGRKDDNNVDNKKEEAPKTNNLSWYQQWKARVFDSQIRIGRFLSFSLPAVLEPMPRPVPVTVVVGKPLEFRPEKEEISEQDVDKYLQMYMDEIVKLYNEYKGQYGLPGVEIEIM